jgi:hypothetical protein
MQLWWETPNAAYMMRQHFFANLYDRLSTRPFLTALEKVRHTGHHIAAIADACQVNYSVSCLERPQVAVAVLQKQV